ncbi:hypothetical protein HNY73_005275 [Argiope bruennichi]|uniref:Uncharacterized protein n=1 Tax=Argiope bruennichi TaxID=94029 RepID=A0A8T0FFZ2_ARGBR|nr:hypothetical protein HNY73_005275 [Argiope bruennichi]
MLQHLIENDPDLRIEFCEWALSYTRMFPVLLVPFFFRMRYIFMPIGERTNKMSSTRWMVVHIGCRTAKSLLLCRGNSWCVAGNGLSFIEENLNVTVSLDILKMTFSSQSFIKVGTSFCSSGKTEHYGIEVCQWLDQQFPGNQIRGSGPLEWPSSTPVFIPLDFLLLK